MILAAKNFRRGGFTLIELVVVLVLIGIMAAMIIPQMQGSFEDSLLRTNGRKMIDVLQLAYSRAVSMGQAHRVHLDTAKNQFTVEKQISGGAEPRFAALEGLTGTRGPLDPRISFEIRSGSTDTDQHDAVPTESAGDEGAARPEGVVFYADGTADAAEILLRDRAGFRLRLRINPITAGIQIVEEEKTTP
jgi:type II secretion system protein H